MRQREGIRIFSFGLVLTLFLFVGGVSIPLIGLLLIPLVPQPALAFGLKYGRDKALALLLAAALVLFLLGGKELGLVYSLLALMVMFLLFSFGRGWSIEAVVAGTAGATLAAVIGLFLFLFRSLPALGQSVRAVLRENLELSLKIYEKIGLSNESMEIIRERAPQTIEVITEIMPALAFASFVIVILINLFFLHRRFPDHRSLFISAVDLKEWKAPEPLVWLFILAGFSLFLPMGEVLRTVALNIFLVTAIFYFFQGISIVAYYFHHKKVSFFFRALTYVLVVFEQLFTLIVVGLGLFDLWGDFRRLKKKDLKPDPTISGR